MSPVGFEIAVSESERPQTDALDCAATGNGLVISWYRITVMKKHKYTKNSTKLK